MLLFVILSIYISFTTKDFVIGDMPLLPVSNNIISLYHLCLQISIAAKKIKFNNSRNL